MITLDLAFFAVAIPAVILSGLSKGGFGAGLGVLSVPLMALAMPPVAAAAIMLPLLVLMDAVSLMAFRRVVRWSVIRDMLPGALIGTGLGWATAAHVDDNLFRILVGTIALAFALYGFAGDRLKWPPARESALRASFWATFAGYTSFVAHAGGPPFQAYALPLKLERLHLAGTSAVFFAVVNAVKLPPYFMLGQFDANNLTASAALAPVAMLGVMAGVWSVRRMSQQAFYNITYAAMILIGSKLVFDGISALP